MNTAKSGTNRWKWTALLRRRRGWALAALAIGLAATAALAWRAEPTYRAIAPLTLDGMTLPAGFEEPAARDYVVDHLNRAQQRVRDEQGFGGTAAGIRLDSLEVGGAGPDGLRSVSATFDVRVDGADPRAAERAVTAMRESHLAVDRSSTLPAGVPADELEAARLDAQRLAEDLLAAELALEAFQQENAAALPGFETVNAQAVRETERELAALDRRRLELEGRRNELDRGLGDMRADYRRMNRQAPLSTETLTARQMEWAALRGLYGPDYGPAVELGREITALQADADDRLRAVNRELDEASAELARLERSYPPDHPDVIRATYQVSLLETRAAALRITGLTNSERTYIESLARERREIDATIEQVRAELAALEQRLTEHQGRAEQAPVIEQRHAALQQQVAGIRDAREAAQQRYDTLQNEHRLAQAHSPGRLSAAGTPRVSRAAISDPAAIAAAGSLLTLLGALLLVGLVDRIDRRIIGADAVERLQGRRPLIEIPFVTDSVDRAVPAGGALTLAGVAWAAAALGAGLLLTAVASDDVGEWIMLALRN